MISSLVTCDPVSPVLTTVTNRRPSALQPHEIMAPWFGASRSMSWTRDSLIRSTDSACSWEPPTTRCCSHDIALPPEEVARAVAERIAAEVSCHDPESEATYRPAKPAAAAWRSSSRPTWRPAGRPGNPLPSHPGRTRHAQAA